MLPHYLQHFMAWWKQGLLALVPETWKPSYPQLHINYTEKGFLVSREDSAEQSELATVVSTDYMDHIANCELTLFMPEHGALQSELQLPASAEHSLNAILGHEIEKYTPFTQDQIYYGYNISTRDVEQKTITVHFSAMPRSSLDSILQDLASHGIRPHQVRIPGQENMLPVAMRPALPGSAWRNTVPPLLLCLVLGLLCAYVPLWQQHQALQQLDNEIQQHLPLVTKLQQLREQQQQAMTRSNFFNDRRDSHIPAIELLEHISMLLPDDTALRSLKLDKGYITLTGESGNASGLIALLESSPLLSEPAFRSPVIHSDRTQREQFTITASLQQDDEDDDS